MQTAATANLECRSEVVPATAAGTATVRCGETASADTGFLRIRAAYIGQEIDHCENVVSLFASAGMPLPVLKDSISWGAYANPPRLASWKPITSVWRKSARLLGQLHGTLHTGYDRYLSDELAAGSINCVLAYWGGWVLGDVLALKRQRPDVKVILNALCHPTGLSAAKVAAQNWYFRRAAAALDGIIVSSGAMAEYFRREAVRRSDMPYLVWPPRYSENVFPTERLPDCPHQPNLLFLGRMDWSRSQPSDNCGRLLQELLDAGVHVHHHYSRESDSAHPTRHTFKYMPLPQAVRYATQFDASLIAYNLDACGRTDRFEVTVPDRLVASVAAGIPVAVPTRGYSACKEYLREFGAVIEFSSPAELAERLRDRPALAQLKAMARANSRKYCGEKHVPPLLEFIRIVLGQ